MTLGVIGAVLLLLLAFMWWRGHTHLWAVLVTLLLGIIIAKSGGTIGMLGDSLVNGIRAGGTAVAGLFGKK